MSIHRVAELAGVSAATVSRMINQTGLVSLQTEQQIRSAMQQLGYVPRAHRPGRRQPDRQRVRSGHVILLTLWPFAPAEVFAMPALPALFGGIQQELSEHGLNLLVAHSPAGIPVPPVLAGSKADGVLLVGNVKQLGDRLQTRLARTPCVWLLAMPGAEPQPYDHVTYDNQVVGPLAAHYFHELGHRHVAYLSADPCHPAYTNRRDGFRAACAELGMKVTVWEAPERLPGGLQQPFVYHSMAALARQVPQPTAVFCHSDECLLHAHFALRQVGLEPERDVTLLGCNRDEIFLRQLHPRPATIDIKFDLLGRKAVDLLWQRLRAPRAADGCELLIKPCLVPGDAMRPIPTVP